MMLSRLVVVMAEKRISVKELAEKVGLSEVTISGWRSGKRSPSMKALEKLAEALNVEVKELF